MAKPEAGRDPKMAERTLKLNVVFALTSIALLITLSLMIWFDYAREWKKHQVAFNDLEKTQTRTQVEAVDKQVGERLRAIEGELKQGEQEASQNSGAIREAERELAKLDARWYAADQDFRFTKAKIDVERYEYDEAVHKKSSRAERELKDLTDLEQKLDRYRLEREEIEARQAEQKAKLAALGKTGIEAEAKRKALLFEKTRLEDRLKQLDRGVVWFVRNLPIVEQFNPSLKINQILPANLYDDVIFTPTPKADRCTTCHLGIDKKGYETAAQPYRTHPNLDLFLRGPHPIDRIGCTVCHQGRGRATSFHKAAHTASSKEQEKAWGKHIGKHEYEPLHYWDYPMLAKGSTESQCAKCHKDVVEVPKADRLNTGVFLIERYGCNGCHKIKGWEGLRKVGPTSRASPARPTRTSSSAGSRSRAASAPRACRRCGTCASTRRPSSSRATTSRPTRSRRTSRPSRRASSTPRRPRATSTPAARASRRSAAWPATASATTCAASRAPRWPRSARTARTSTAPAARSTRAGCSPGSRTPAATGTRPRCRGCA
jgi:hypothetical protein